MIQSKSEEYQKVDTVNIKADAHIKEINKQKKQIAESQKQVEEMTLKFEKAQKDYEKKTFMSEQKTVLNRTENPLLTLEQDSLEKFSTEIEQLDANLEELNSIVQTQPITIEECEALKMDLRLEEDRLRDYTQKLKIKKTEFEQIVYQNEQCFHKNTDIKVRL